MIGLLSIPKKFEHPFWVHGQGQLNARLTIVKLSIQLQSIQLDNPKFSLFHCKIEKGLLYFCRQKVVTVSFRCDRVRMGCIVVSHDPWHYLDDMTQSHLPSIHGPFQWKHWKSQPLTWSCITYEWPRFSRFMIQSLKLAIETSTERVFEVTASHEDSVVRLQLIIGLIRFWSFAKMNA